MKVLIYLFVLSFSFNGHAQNYNIIDFGAKAEKGFLNTGAIQSAIDKCSETGGKVVIPADTFMTGSLEMKDNVHIYLSNGAVILGSPDPDDYIEYEHQFPAYTNFYQNCALFFGRNVKDIVIEGKGMIDFNGGSPKFSYESHEEWVGSQEELKRPYGLYLIRCENVKISGLKLVNAAFWMQHYLECKNLRFWDLDVINHANYNGDGMDINNCKDVIIHGCRISGGDDAICLKSTSYSYSENITISDCILRSDCNTFKIGTETHGAIKNVVLSNCVMGAAQHKQLDGFWDVGISGISLQSNDGAVVENITITNVTIDSMMAPFFIRLQDRGRKVEESQEDPPVGTLRNIRIANVTATNMTAMASSITGVSGCFPENVEFENISIHTVGGGTKEEVNTEVPELNGSYPDAYMFKTDLPGYGFFIRHVKNIKFRNVSITVGSDDARHGIVLENVRDGYFSELFLNGKNSQFSAIKTTDVKNVIFNDIFYKDHPLMMNE